MFTLSIWKEGIENDKAFANKNIISMLYMKIHNQCLILIWRDIKLR